MSDERYRVLKGEGSVFDRSAILRTPSDIAFEKHLRKMSDFGAIFLPSESMTRIGTMNEKTRKEILEEEGFEEISEEEQLRQMKRHSRIIRDERENE